MEAQQLLLMIRFDLVDRFVGRWCAGLLDLLCRQVDGYAEERGDCRQDLCHAALERPPHISRYSSDGAQKGSRARLLQPLRARIAPLEPMVHRETTRTDTGFTGRARQRGALSHVAAHQGRVHKLRLGPAEPRKAQGHRRGPGPMPPSRSVPFGGRSSVMDTWYASIILEKWPEREARSRNAASARSWRRSCGSYRACRKRSESHDQPHGSKPDALTS